MRPRGWWLAALALAGCDPTCADEVGNACEFAGIGGELALSPDGLAPEETELYWAMDMEFAPDGTPYFIDWNNHLIRRVVDGHVETVVGNFVGDGPATGNDIMQAVPGTEVRLNHPTDMQFEPDGTMIFAAWHNHKLRRVDTDDMCQTVIGRGAGFAGDGGPASMALLNQPSGIVRTEDGRMFILDQRNFRIRMIDADGNISTVVGDGMAGFGGDGGPPREAQLRFEAGPNPEPSGGIAYDDAGDILYIADGLNHVIRRVDFGADTIETIVGTPGEPGYGGDGGAGTEALINHPRNVEIGPDGRVYFADTENDRIRVWDPSSGQVDTVVGNGTRGLGLANQPAIEISLDRPFGIAFDADGALYVADTFNSRFLRIPQ
jgi:hypothetical protein